MLNQEQIEYLTALRINYPGIQEDVFQQTLVDAAWTAEEIHEAFMRYQGTFAESHRQKQKALQTDTPTAYHSVYTPAVKGKSTIATSRPRDTTKTNTNMKQSDYSTLSSVLTVIGFLLIFSTLGFFGYYAMSQTNTVSSQELFGSF